MAEFNIRIPKRDPNNSLHIMKFKSSMNIDPSNWSRVRMIRENNKKNKENQPELPKFGAGSEYGREQREEARRRRYGQSAKKYNADDQPWLMKVGSKKESKQFRGTKEGGVSENAAYYVFTQALDGTFEAHRVKEWYNFTPAINYKTLSAEEAEEKFALRDKTLNHWSTMVNKKLRSDQELDEEEEKAEKISRKSGRFQVTDMDDDIFNDEDDIDSDDDEEKNNSDDEDNKNKKKDKKKKKKKDEVEEEAFEDSDDGDDEGKEMDYISDESSDSEDEILEQTEQKGVDQNEAIADMFVSDSDSDEVSDFDEEDESNDKKPDDENDKINEDSSTKEDSKIAKAEKRKAIVENLMDINAVRPSAKKSRFDLSNPVSSSLNLSKELESSLEKEARKYLLRKPMTTGDLVKRLKTKFKKELNNDDISKVLRIILPNINPHKKTVKGIMYLSLKS